MMKMMQVMFGVLIFSSGFAQSTVHPQVIQVTVRKTVAIIFPCAIKDVDYGSAGVIVQQRSGAKNMLQVKAAQENFLQTSLSVVTTDGCYYSFLVDYSPDAERLTYVMEEHETNCLPVQDHAQLLEEDELRVARTATPFLHRRSRRQSLQLALNGIYQAPERMWFRLSLENFSAVDFPIAFVQFSLKDKRRAKRHAVEEKDILPTRLDYASTIEGHHISSVIAAFSPFVCPPGKRLVVQIGSAGGDRLVTLRIPAKFILRARTL